MNKKEAMENMECWKTQEHIKKCEFCNKTKAVEGGNICPKCSSDIPL